MADLPIIFSPPMVRALLDGHKTQTRRVQHKDVSMACSIYNSSGRPIAIDATAWDRRWPVRTRYAVGDRLYVREAWTASMTHGWTIADARSRMYQAEILYRADGHDSIDGWWPSIHMPREFSRITLTVTDVRVQRLNDISEADAQAEGAPAIGAYEAPDKDERSHRWGFINLWNILHGPRAWESNPWVAAYTFTVARGNIDQPGVIHG